MSNTTVDINKCLAKGMLLEARHNEPICRRYYQIITWMIIATIVLVFFGAYVLMVR